MLIDLVKLKFVWVADGECNWYRNNTCQSSNEDINFSVDFVTCLNDRDSRL